MAHADDKIVLIRSKFGMWGIGTYWTLVERAAEQMEYGHPAEVSLHIPELCSFLGCKRNKLVSFLDHSRNIHAMEYSVNADVLVIKVKKLEEMADNYTKFDGLSTKRLQRQKEMSTKQEEEVEGEVDKNKIKVEHKDKIPASVEEVVTYFQKLKASHPEELDFINAVLEAHTFFDNFKSNGWLIGKARTPMKDWKAAVRNWIRNAKKWRSNGAGQQGNRRNSKAGGATTANDLRESLEITKRLKESNR